MRGREIQWLQHKAVGGCARIGATEPSAGPASRRGPRFLDSTQRCRSVTPLLGEFLVVQFQFPVPVPLHGPVYPLQGYSPVGSGAQGKYLSHKRHEDIAR